MKSDFKISKLFSSSLHCVDIREDSELIGVGEDCGRVIILDSKKKMLLRKFEGHSKRVGDIKFMSKH